MKQARIVRNPLLAVLLALALATSLSGAQARPADQQPAGPQEALGTAFTYQGQLRDGGSLANGSYDFQFVLYDAAVGGAQVSGTPILTQNAVAVSNGQFTVQLDFGDVFGDSKLYLEIAVRPAGGSSYTTLSPRQELTPAPFARFARFAGFANSAASAQSVPWTAITGKPAALSLRKIYVPGGGLGYPATVNFSPNQWGLLVKNSSQYAGFVTPAPADWDTTTPFTVTVYFALPTLAANSVVNWRLWAGGSELNLGAGDAGTGWDSLDYGAYEDGTPLNVYAAPGHSNMMKSQSWTAKWSTTYHTWYFGSSVTVANSFSTNPIWHFSFLRGATAGNGETYIGDIVVVGAEIAYRAAP